MTSVTVRPGTMMQGQPHLPCAKYPAVRALLLAALGDGPSVITGLTGTDDIDVLLAALARCGIALIWQGTDQLTVTGCAGAWPVARTGELVELEVGNAGAVLRLLLGALATLPAVRFTTRYPESLGKRPNAELLAALRQLGVTVEAQGLEGLLPITLRRGTLHGGTVAISGARSSQFISALLLLAPQIGEDLTIQITDDLPSASFVRLTIALLQQVGIVIDHDPALQRLHIPSPQIVQPRAWRLPRDFPAAATWLAIGSIAGGAITVVDLAAEAEDGLAVLAALRALGAEITSQPTQEAGQITLTAQGGRPLHGAQLDGAPIIDSVPVLAALACAAEGTTTFTNVATLRLKESNRLDDLCQELTRAGALAHATVDTLTIVGQPLGVAGGVTVSAHQDHRLAMALAVLALRAHDSITITDAEHVAKSYPGFWEEWARLGDRIQSMQ